jgi:2-oxoglutarate dehydrogenase E2 component (dihydrolipoamide succinyltransferase)
MKSEIKVPSMGESISEVTIGQILLTNGSSVKADEPILEIETDKVNQLLYAPQAGTLSLSVQTGAVVKVGQNIGAIEGEEQKTKTSTKEEANIEEKPKESSSLPEKVPEIKVPEIKDVQQVRQTKEDFFNELKSPTLTSEKQIAPLPQPSVTKKTEAKETRRRMSTIRRVIAKRLLDVQHTTAMLTTFNEVDLSQVMQLREKYKESFVKKHGVKLGFMSFFIKACVAALELFPDLNSYIEGEEIVHREYYDISVAVGTDKGLFVPVVRNCNQLSFAQIEQSIEEYAKRAREGTLAVNDLQGGGFTITNGGVYGSLLSTPILNPPQSGILGMHKIEKRPIVVEDQIVIRPMMYIALSYDHRIVDGKEAVSFLVALKGLLEDPSRLLLDI